MLTVVTVGSRRTLGFTTRFPFGCTFAGDSLLPIVTGLDTWTGWVWMGSCLTSSGASSAPSPISVVGVLSKLSSFLTALARYCLYLITYKTICLPTFVQLSMNTYLEATWIKHHNYSNLNILQHRPPMFFKHFRSFIISSKLHDNYIPKKHTFIAVICSSFHTSSWVDLSIIQHYKIQLNERNMNSHIPVSCWTL